jgi:hypothetical protein
MANASTRLMLGLRLNWIKEWDVNSGLTAEHLTGIRCALGRGWPVCAGLRWPKQAEWRDEVLQTTTPTAPPVSTGR